MMERTDRSGGPIEQFNKIDAVIQISDQTEAGATPGPSFNASALDLKRMLDAGKRPRLDLVGIGLESG